MPPATGPPPSLSETDHYWIEIFPPQKGSMLERYIWDVRYKGHLLGLSFSSEQEASIERAIEESTEGASVPDRLTGPPSPAAVRLHPVMGDDSESLSDGSLSPLSPRSPTSMMSDSTLIDSPSPLGNAKGYDQMELLSLDTVASLVLHGDSTTASRTMQNTYRGIYVKPEHGVIKQTQSVRVVEVYQCYTVHIQFYQNPSQAMIDSGFSNQPALDTFTVVLDTGSSVSWLVGRNCCLIYHNANGEMSLTPANFDKSQSPSDKTKSKVIKHSFTWDSEKNEGKVHDNAITGEIIYSDGSKTLLTLMQKPQRDVMFGDCFAWNEQASWTTQSKMSYQFGVAYATTPWLHSSCIAGVLGLDLTTYHGNNTFNGYTGDSIPTFTAALIEQRILKPGYSRVGSTQGITFFFAMRPKGSISSFFALNTWPCNTAPPWTPGISVIPTNNQWAVRLISIWFERKTVTSESTSSGWEVLPKSRYQFSASADSGVEVCLDTGSSLSWLPAGFVQHLRHVVFTESAGFPHAGALNSFLNAEGIPINITAHLTPTQVTYFGNECPPDQWRVGLCFKGYTQDYVDVYAPVNPFICTMNNNTGNSEGLICSPAKEDSVYILGINFFQAMFVAMHNVRLGQPRRAFVRMAPQWPSLHDDYTPPEPILDDC